MEHSAEYRRCIENLDVAGMQKLHAHVSPHLHQSDELGILISLHIARTQAEFVPLRLRAYSHRWCVDNGYPSSLPDHLKASADRLYPEPVKAVGISVNFKSEWLRPAANEIRKAMEDVVNDAHAEKLLDDTAFVKKRMAEARSGTMRKLFGRLPLDR